MKTSLKNSRTGWAFGLLLLTAGFVVGLAVSGGGGGDGALGRAIATPQAVASNHGDAGFGQMSYADVAASAMPSVVNISSDKVVEAPDFHPFMDDPFFRRFFGEPNERGNRERVERSLGSGVIVRADGYILTSNHVIEKASKIRVVFGDDKEYEAEIIGQDPQTDVALIKIEAQDLPAITIGSSKDLRIGDQVMAIGNPFGVGQTVTLGIVSALARSINLVDYEDFIQTDASINPGNSGGALVNMRGELVGVNTAILSRSGGSQGVGFAIPTHLTSQIMDMLIADGKVRRAWLGVQVQDISPSMAEALGLDAADGVLVASLDEDTPAGKAGMKEGDIILAIDGEKVDSVSRLRNRISLSGIETEIEVDLLRDGRGKTLKVKLEEMPGQGADEDEDSDAPAENGIEGVSARELNQAYRQRFDIDDDVEGVIVADVERTSNAWNAGLRPGQIITEIAREKVNDLDDYRRLVKKDPDKPLLLRIRQGDNQIFMAIPR